MADDKKCYWIIGASSGIGKALAFQLDKQGHSLILSARRKELLDELNLQLSGNHSVVAVDVAHTESINSALENIQTSNITLNSVIFMAGIYAPGPIVNMDIDHAKKIIDVNFTGCINVIHCLLPIFRQQQHGQIAICSSVAAYRGLPNGQIYSATKAALSNFTESLKIETKEFGIDVKLISPGFVKTTMTDKNDFKMPMIIEPESAAKSIIKGLDSNAFEIHFPKRFTYLMKMLQMIPYFIYFKFIR